MRFRCSLDVSLKTDLLDPQGKAVEATLPAMGWANVTNVRIGKHVELDVDAVDEESAVKQVHDLAERVLSNPVIERFVLREIQEYRGLTFEAHR